MIKESLQFLAEELNKYLDLKLSGDVNNPRLVVSNIALASQNTVPVPDIKDRAVLTLINVEEEKALKNQSVSPEIPTGVLYKNPPNYLGLNILISINRKNYSESLDFLSYVIQFFQYQNVFTQSTHPALNSSIQKLIVELHSMNFEQLNHIWSILGGKHLPSVLYKVRQITLNQDANH